MSMLDSLFQPERQQTVGNADFVAFVGDAGNTEIMRRYVSQRMLPHAVVEQGTIETAIDHLVKMERAPQQLVVDISRYDTPLSELAQLAEVCDPSVDVYVLGDRNDVGLYRSLLQLGIRDYLVKPLTVDLLTRTLGDGAAGRSEPVQGTRTGKVISLVGARGGVGVSTIAVHLGRALAEHKHRRVALVDLDLYGGAINLLLGLQGNQGLIDVLGNVQRLDPQYMERTLVKHSNRLFVLSCELDYTERFEPVPGALGQLIEILKHYFHYVLLDLPRPGNLPPALSEEVLDQSKLVYLVADQTVHSARRVAQLARHFAARQNEPVVSVLLNHTVPPSDALVARSDFSNATQRPVLQELPFDPATLLTAQNLGEALDAHAPFAQAIDQLADDLSGAGQKAAPKASGRSHWLQQLRRRH